jgi:hypothetical protein
MLPLSPFSQEITPLTKQHIRCVFYAMCNLIHRTLASDSRKIHLTDKIDTFRHRTLKYNKVVMTSSFANKNNIKGELW